MYGDNFVVICRGIGDENVLWYVFKELISEEEWEWVGKEWNKDGCVYEYEVN